jgi:hypothetical protein
LHEGEAVDSRFVVPRGHPTALLDPVEEAHDPVAWLRRAQSATSKGRTTRSFLSAHPQTKEKRSATPEV